MRIEATCPKKMVSAKLTFLGVTEHPMTVSMLELKNKGYVITTQLGRHRVFVIDKTKTNVPATGEEVFSSAGRAPVVGIKVLRPGETEFRIPHSGQVITCREAGKEIGRAHV
jgi:hypothetical protein